MNQDQNSNLPAGANVVKANPPGTYKILIDLNNPAYAGFLQDNPALSVTPGIDPKSISVVNGSWTDQNGQMYFDFAGGKNTEDPKAELKTCDECKGSGKYVGLTATSDCAKCSGRGKI